jgi:hypothetical protein
MYECENDLLYSQVLEEEGTTEHTQGPVEDSANRKGSDKQVRSWDSVRSHGQMSLLKVKV